MPSNFYYINHGPEKTLGKLEFIHYSHHEKLVVVDDRVGFLSGIDLHLGRFEIFKKYPLFDLDGTFPGVDYSSTYNMKGNENIVTENGTGWEKTLLDRTKENRTPWQDIGITFSGEAAKDLSRHFVQRWNAHLYEDFKVKKVSSIKKILCSPCLGDDILTRNWAHFIFVSFFYCVGRLCSHVQKCLNSPCSI